MLSFFLGNAEWASAFFGGGVNPFAGIHIIKFIQRSRGSSLVHGLLDAFSFRSNISSGIGTAVDFIVEGAHADFARL